jgi:hypothetical protein
MKRIGLIVLLAVVSLFVSAALVLRRTRAVDVAVNVRDLPEYGVRLVSAADPSFNGLAAANLKNISPDNIESNKPFSVFIKNTGNRDLVAYVLKWELVVEDGSIRTHISSEGNPHLLMGAEPTKNPALIELSPVVKPAKVKFCSWIAPAEDQGIGSMTGGTSAGSGDPEVLRRMARGGKNNEIRDYMQTQLRQGRSITISVDGAFFDDGTFVGPNTTGFYEQIQAQIKAKHDLLEEANNAFAGGKQPDEIFKMLEPYTSLPQASYNSGSTPEDVYDFWKKTYAEEAINMRRGGGARPVLDRMLSLYRKPWPELKRRK